MRRIELRKLLVLARDRRQPDFLADTEQCGSFPHDQ
jgi:hypothetical protein